MTPEAHTDPHGHDHPHPHDHRHDHRHGPWRRLRHLATPHSHDAAGSVDAALATSERGIRAVKLSLVVLGVTAALQLVVVGISGSVALLADTIHNASDALTSVPLWIAFALGRRAATRRYTYGFGRAEDLAGLSVILVIGASAVLAGWQAVTRVVDPAPVHAVGWVAVAGVVGFLGNEAVALFRIREGRAIGSAALVADGHHARADGLTSLAVVAGAGGLALGLEWADPVIGLLITVAILLVLRTAARDVLRRLMDGIEPEHVDRAEAALRDLDGVVGVRRLRMRWVGHEIRAEAELDVEHAVSATDAHGIAHRAETVLTRAVPRLTAAVVHAYPASAAAAGGPRDGTGGPAPGHRPV